MPHGVEIRLGDRAGLGLLLASGDRRPQERARIILVLGDSAGGNSGVAAELGISVEMVRKWRSRFAESGVAGLGDAPRPGRATA